MNIKLIDDPDLKRLFRTVAAKRGRASFIIIDNSDVADANLIQQISSHLDKESIRSQTLDLSTVETVSDLLDRLKEYKENDYGFLHITGGDEWLLQRQPFNDRTALRSDVLTLREKTYSA